MTGVKEITTFTAATGGARRRWHATEFVRWTIRRSGLHDRQDYQQQLMEDIELLDGASDEFDMERSAGNLSPVFFGSALTNFGVETFLEHFLQMTTLAARRETTTGAW